MPLSEHEQRLLEQMERALYQEDPKFASSLRDGGPRRGSRRLLAVGVVLVLAGVGALLAGVASTLAIIGIVGFVLMLGGAYLVVLSLRAPDPETTPEGDAPAKPTRKARQGGGFMGKAEDRFKKRRDEQQGP